MRKLCVPTPGAVLLLFLLRQMAASGDSQQLPAQDADAVRFEAGRRALLDQSTDARVRHYAMRDILESGMPGAEDVIAEGLRDPALEVRKEAAELLSDMNDPRGLIVDSECVKTLACAFPSDAARRLGNSRRERFAPILSSNVRRLLGKGQRAKGGWSLDGEDRSLLERSIVALAQIGRVEDRELVLEFFSAAVTPWRFEALGYIDDPRSRKVLWAAYDHYSKYDEDHRVPEVLLALSRIGDPLAAEKVTDALRAPEKPHSSLQNSSIKTYCPAGGFLGRLRHRDSDRFAEVVLEVAAREPEDQCTFAAWQALGVMHPVGFGKRVLALAVSKRPHWKTVSRGMLNDVVIALDPSLNEEFWVPFSVQHVPRMTTEKSLVRHGLGYKMFSGVSPWEGE